MEDNWRCIFQSTKVYEAEMLRGMLIENEIDAVVINKQDSNYLFGEAELYVKQDDVLKANSLINEAEL